MRQMLEKNGLMALPVGFHKESNKIVTLAKVFDDIGLVIAHDRLDFVKQQELVLKRWKEGGWLDVYVCEDLITLDRAVMELENKTPLGKRLMIITLRAIEIRFEAIMDYYHTKKR